MTTPWLDNLSDDWSVSDPPSTPISNALVPLSSPTAVNSPSRIPVPARRSLQKLPSPDKKVTRPCHFYHREPPTPKRRAPFTPKKLRSPLPGEIKPFIPNPDRRRSSMRLTSLTPASAEKRPKKLTMDAHSPLRSVSHATSNSGYDTTSTVQIKPKKARAEGGSTPEWRKRLVRGEFGAGEQRDLFAPMGLESVFKPPTPGSSAQKDLNPFTRQEDHLWDFTDATSRPSSAVDGVADDVDADEERVDDENYTELESPFGTVNMRSKPKEPNNELSVVDPEGSSQAGNTSMRTASRLEDLRNEGITPITFTEPNTLERNAPSEFVKSALKQVTNKLANLSVDHGSRPGSAASDGFLFTNNNNEDEIDGSPREDSLLDVTSQSLPQDLSMGTVDFSSRRPSSRPIPGKFSPSPFPSQDKSHSTLANTKIRSSPLFNPSHGHGSPALPRPSSSHVRPSTAGAVTRDIAMPSSGSPLKLFGEHDTFTNNRLLRRMSQFEETFHDGSDGDDPPSPSEEARRKGENRSFLSARNEPLREISSKYNERLASRNSGRPQLNRFGDGELDQFDFSDTSPYGNKPLYESKDVENRRPGLRMPTSTGRQPYLRRGSHQDSTHGYRSGSSGFTRKASNWTRNSYNMQDARSSRVNRKENDAPDAKRVPKAASDPKPKRRRTLMQDVSVEPLENGDQASKSFSGMSLLQKSLIKQGIQLENSEFLAPPGASMSMQRPRTPTPSQIRLANEAALAASREYSESNYDNNDYSDSFTIDGDIPFVKVTGTSDTSRKGSITTQDYLNEATKIMDLIRSKGRPAAGMTSLQEREGTSEDENASFEDESTQEAFSRPPSRDGIDLRKIREQKEINPQILNYLKMYQEKDGEGKIPGEGELYEPRRPSISGPRKRKPSPTDDVAEKIAYDLMTINTQISGFSVRSFPTGSSQNSQAKGVLTSDVLSHLIPAQVNGFTYDRMKNQWVKEDSEHPSSPSADGEDNDPFQDIPDLSVDELQEMLRVHGLDSPTKSLPDQSQDLDVPKLRAEKTHELNVPHQLAANLSPKKTDARPPIGRETSVGGEIFIPRPISRIEEQSEEASENLSVIHRKDLLAVQQTPGQNFETSLVPVGTLGHDNSYSFYLSPLADFSVNQSDHNVNLELSYVAQRTNPKSLRHVHGTFAQAIEELVKHITAAAPNVTFWDDLRRLVLRQKGLLTLHKLNEFCPRLEELDVSDNEIGQLSGIPPTLRTLKIPRNSLSEVTAWGHLINLQYLDVSGNEIESLDGFSSLVHLRELRANNNKVRSLNGVRQLNGLLTLKLSHNSISTVDFEGAELNRLRDLDLSHNCLASVRNAEWLPSLTTLDLSANIIEQFEVSSSLISLRTLKLSGNRLESFNAKGFSSVNLLYLDQNRLSNIIGLEHCQNLDVLSVREQITISGPVQKPTLDIDLGLVKDVRKVFISSNRLSSRCLSPSLPLLRLQLLDIASCGLPRLPSDFSVNFANVKVLNMNFNSISDLEALVGMNCLSRLLMASNRLARMRRVCQILSRLGRTSQVKQCSLRKLDIRGNPLTVAFYPPALTGNGAYNVRKKTKEDKAAAQDSHQELSEALANLDQKDRAQPIIWDNGTTDAVDLEINDPSNLPPQDPEADKKYLIHLDRTTRLRRRVLELLLYAGTGGSLQVLDGLDLRPSLGEECMDMASAWNKLEKLGVLRRRAIKDK